MPVPNWKETPDQNDIVVVLVKSMVSPVAKFIVLGRAVAVSNGYTLRRLTSIRVIDRKAIAIKLLFFKISILPFDLSKYKIRPFQLIRFSETVFYVSDQFGQPFATVKNKS